MRARKRRLLLALCVVASLGFCALGVWQLARLQWKRDLIARVDARVHAAPVALPPRSAWPMLTTADAEYRRIRLEGRFLDDKTTLVDALTELGPGFWVVTPLRTAAGNVLVNRGFVPPSLRDSYPRADGDVVVTGLLRLSEPNGRILRANRPAENRWYSRDVDAIAAARSLSDFAPFFIDAEGPARAYPVGGLTVVHFRNAHLAYALTWFALAALAAFGCWRAYRDDPR